jgi:oxygen-independent coproporphyrinogen-3 oxidase
MDNAMNQGLIENEVNRAKVQEIQDYIERKRYERQVNKILHGFPSPRLWQEKNIPVDQAIHTRQGGDHPRNRFWLYISTPYCLRTDPDKCGYCLFPVEVYEGMGQLEQYLAAIEKELEMYSGLLDDCEITTVFFGGGTPNLYKDAQYGRLIGLARKLLPNIKSDVPFILEGIPQLFTRDKLMAMKDAGINRVSMGAQQMNEELNKLSGRKQKARHIFQAVEWCDELGLQSNVDLIFGWPRQTTELMLKDLESLVNAGVRHITHYELNIAGSSDFAINRHHELPSVQQNLEMYRASKEFLESRGFRQLSVYDWDKPAPGDYVYQECVREFDTTGIFGLGYAAVSYFPGAVEDPGWTWVNHRNLNDYFADVERGKFPIERGFKYAIEDLRLTMLWRNFQGGEANSKAYKALFGSDLVEEYRPIWQALVERGWARITDDRITLIGDGVYYTPMIETMLGKDRIEVLKKQLKQTLLPVLQDV